jgi:hypothetical protein
MKKREVRSRLIIHYGNLPTEAVDKSVDELRSTRPSTRRDGLFFRLTNL